MRKFISAILFSLFSLSLSSAQEWSATLNTLNGLPGVEEFYSTASYYRYTSPQFTPGVSVDRVRITVLGTLNNEAPNGNNIIFSLSGLTIYDGDGNKVDYIAYSNADHNSLTYSSDGDGLPALSDDNIKTHFHSMWGYPAVTEFHYIELSLAHSVKTFSFEWTSRLGEPKNTPLQVAVTLGTDYDPNASLADFALGSAVTTLGELAQQSNFFVLRGNAQSYFTTSTGTTYMGSGPVYMQYAEEGDKEPTANHIMQLIPAGGDRYLVYWPMSGMFLANSLARYNGLNGWQYSTTDFMSAAAVKLTPVSGGYFEMEYDGTYLGSDMTVFVGAELRDGVDSKMKIFDLDHKTALENGDYTQGYSLPVAFNWSIYNAEISKDNVENLYVTLSQLATSYLQPFVTKAESYLATYGNHDGYCVNGEDMALESAIGSVRQTMATANDVAEIGNAEQAILQALSRYMSVGLGTYEAQINTLLATERFTSYPYSPGTYPESSRTLLEGMLSTISAAKAKAGVYTAEEYVALFLQLQNDLNGFYSTKIEDTPSGGGDDNNREPELVDGEVVFVYLKNGDIDAYSIASLENGYYEENGVLYFPISGGDLVVYDREEYDSCSTVFPQLPEMTSFKFNNKYNPNLNVDAIAEEVSENMFFSLNAIGKWLTASFQLSDDKAVAYVDTVLQESKVTRMNFANGVTYKVTYPGYNIVERVKVQDEIWNVTLPSGGETEIPLTASMLSTNKPSQQYNEGLANLLDNNDRTIFHSTWGSANNATVNVDTYIDIALPYSVEDIKIYYQTRPGTGYNPLEWEIYKSNDGAYWELARTLNYLTDEMPTNQASAEYTSPVINLGGEYSYIRILQTRGEYSKNHFVLAELRLYDIGEAVDGDSIKVQDAVYENRYRPFGREYNVDIEWLTDNAVSVPRIDIDIDGGAYVTSKDYYLNANFRITGYGLYENFEDSVQIKGRGNSSWGHTKKPYRLKFAEKVKPFGLTKGKSWVLLANAQEASLMANAIAMKIGQMAGTEYPNHIIPVELYMNGRYMGSYMFTEKVGMANNSVDVDEEQGYLLELDTYSSTSEPIYRTGPYNLPVKISEPDLAELPSTEATTRRTKIQSDVKTMSYAVYYGEDIENYLDMEALASFYLANDLTLNQEINHPKSTFLYMDESEPNAKLKFGPIWDFDWGFGYETSYSYCVNGATSNLVSSRMDAYTFWRDISSSSVFKKYYYKAWVEFLQNNSIDELLDYIDSYYDFAESSFQNNYNYGHTYFYRSDAERAKEWLVARKDYIVGNLTEYNIEELLHPMIGDVDCNDVVTVHDVSVVVGHLNNNTHRTFNEVKADCDENGTIDFDDAYAVANIVLESDVPSSMYWYTTPEALGSLYAHDFDMELGEEVVVPLNLLSYNTEGYSALQFDIKVPDGLFIYDITPGAELEGYNFLYSQIDMTTYRVVFYSDENCEFTTGDDVVANITASVLSVVEEDLCAIEICNAYAVNGDNDERRLNDASIRFGQATGIGNNFATVAIKGGDCITITALEAHNVYIYGVDGRLVRKLTVTEGTTRVSLPAGLYIVNGKKVLVY